ncbi:MAG TPA: type II toxin-antitoxin system VapC family toxin [Caulobacteraceae bacterium]|nr:type II toxin-antitoxin system VapC family toxin [Caulobacteraceae bacterium]
MSVIIDASVALKWVLDEPGAEAALALQNEELIAPALWLVEVANALWRRTSRGELTEAEALERLAALADAPVTSTAIELDLLAAAKLANDLRHPVYDCLYLAAAIRENTYVMTADRRFYAVASGSPDHASAVQLLEVQISA